MSPLWSSDETKNETEANQKMSFLVKRFQKGFWKFFRGLSWCAKLARVSAKLAHVSAKLAHVPLAIILAPSALFAQSPLVEGADPYDLGSTPISRSLGGASLGAYKTTDGHYDHPALGAHLERKTLSMAANGLNPTQAGFQVSYMHPTSVGIFGGYLIGAFALAEEQDLNNYISASLSFSKAITTRLDFGLRLTFDYFSANLDTGEQAFRPDYVTGVRSPFGALLDLSFAYLFDVDLQSGVGTISNLVLGVGIKDVGLFPFIDFQDGSLGFIKTLKPLKLGVGFDFIRVLDERENKRFTQRLLAEASLHYPVAASVALGLRSRIYFGDESQNVFSINLGVPYNTYDYTILPVTAGIDASWRLKNVDIGFAQSNMVMRNSQSGSYTDYWGSFSFFVGFGALDDDAPEIDLSDWETKS